jgi:hypothetical protein
MITLDIITAFLPHAKTRSEVASGFREFLDRGMTFTLHGKNRRQFVAAVLKKKDVLVGGLNWCESL